LILQLGLFDFLIKLNMCGIIGKVTNNKLNKDEFQKDLLMMNHRGPDDHGVYFDKKVAMGQTRLSIIDLSKDGHQPMVSRCNDFVIVYNGEIYNFKEIRIDLISKGYKFYSDTDTEVILNGFIEYKEKIVEKLNGMFAFSIYNKKTEEIFLARDMSGIKPLYYFKNENNFMYSSEIRALKKFSEKNNFEAKILFLLLGYVPEPFTIYSNISMFPAGHYGIYKNNELFTVEYDNYKFEPKILNTYSEVVTEASKLFEDSIKRHLISDAPIGVFLSGGLDSSVIVAVASKYKKNLKTLSLVFEDEDLNEEFYQDLIVDKYKTDHIKYLVTEELFLSKINDFFCSMEQPTIDGLNTYLVSYAAKKSGLTAVLSGVGGDEIFYGYPSFRNGRTLKLLSKVPHSIIKIFEKSNKYKKLELLQAEKELAYYLPTRALFSPNEVANILKIDKVRVYNLIAKLCTIYSSTSINKIEDKISFYELNMYMKNQLLRDSDTFGMANSLEIRVPFLDKKLVNYVLRIKSNEKFGKNNKQLLVDMSKDILPVEIYNRPKMGFVLPFEKWFRGNLDKFDLDEEIKIKFKNKQITWSRFWAVLILEKFDKIS
jgi:asparagine synthase (glutamine-hydrolysing)